MTAVLAVLAGGALGPGYLAAVGPSGWQVALALAVEVGVPAAVTAALVPDPEPATPPTRRRPGADPASGEDRSGGAASRRRPAVGQDGAESDLRTGGSRRTPAS